MSGLPSAESLGPFIFTKSYATATVLSGNVDFVADSKAILDAQVAGVVTAGGPTRAIHVGVAGNLVVTHGNGLSETLYGLTPGWHWLRLRGLTATGSTAYQITAAW